MRAFRCHRTIFVESGTKSTIWSVDPLNRPGFPGDSISWEIMELWVDRSCIHRRFGWRAVRMVLEHRSEWAAIRSIAAKLGCASETLRLWVRRAERDQGLGPGLSSDEQTELVELRRSGSATRAGGALGAARRLPCRRNPVVTISRSDAGPTGGPDVGDAPCAVNDSSCRWIHLTVTGFPQGRYTARCVHQGFGWLR